jgi:hypothetical protein
MDEKIKNYKPEEFRRLTGVKPDTFAEMQATSPVDYG